MLVRRNQHSFNGNRGHWNLIPYGFLYSWGEISVGIWKSRYWWVSIFAFDSQKKKKDIESPSQRKIEKKKVRESISFFFLTNDKLQIIPLKFKVVWILHVEILEFEFYPWSLDVNRFYIWHFIIWILHSKFGDI